jgi:hypothetical protein
MEFIDGRIFTDVTLPEVSPEARREWYVAKMVLVFLILLIRCGEAGYLLSALLAR